PVSGMRRTSGSVVEGVGASVVELVLGASVVLVLVLVLVVGATVVVGAAAVVDVTASVVELALSSPPEHADISSPAARKAVRTLCLRITIPSAVQCALRARVGFRISGEVREGDHRRHPGSSVARSTSVP